MLFSTRSLKELLQLQNTFADRVTAAVLFLIYSSSILSAAGIKRRCKHPYEKRKWRCMLYESSSKEFDSIR
jgi:hypothetical protein